MWFEAPEKRPHDDLHNIRRGGYVPEEHLKDMDADGVDGIVYPTVGVTIQRAGRRCCRDFQDCNNWLAEVCGRSQKRPKGIAMINVDDVGRRAIKELHAAQDGAGGGHGHRLSPGEGYDNPMYEPLWAAAPGSRYSACHDIRATNRPGPGQDFSRY